MTTNDAYHYFIENNLATHVDDSHGEYFSNMLRRQTLLAAIENDPDDLQAQRLLLAIEFNQGRHKDAAAIADSLFHATGEDEFAIKKLRCLLLMERFDEATEFNDQINSTRKKPLVDDWAAIQLMRDAIFSDFFLTLREQDYERLFFLRPLLRRFGRHLKFLSYSLSDRFFWELLVFAQRLVEDAGAEFHYISCSDLYSVSDKSETERYLLDRVTRSLHAKKDQSRIQWLQSNPPHMDHIHSNLPHYDDEYVTQICAGPKNMVQSTRLVMSDWKSDYLNVKDGQRVTTDQPENFDSRIVVLGASDAFGFGSEDAHTFCSFLQAKLRSEEPGKTYRVENHGIRGCTLPFSVSNLHQTNIDDGDIVILFGNPHLDEDRAHELGIRNLHIDFSRPHDHGEIFIDHTHFGWTGNNAISDALYSYLFEATDRPAEQATTRPESSDPLFLAAERCVEFSKYLLYRRTYLSVEESAMKEYLHYLDEEKVETSGKIGSVAVNCNPMTNGHLHLLEHAAKSSDFLYVFVIEEDKAYFKFWERLKIVTAGLAHLPNVKVLRGGRYICTDITFPEYSMKEGASDTVADASMEAWFFCEFIASRLGIEKIFLGQEPSCQITMQYNDQMERLLPRFGVAVEIIERVSFAGEAISASRVRGYLEDQRFDLISEIVPLATLSHLMEHHSKP